MPDSAILYYRRFIYRRFIEAPAMDRIIDDAWELAPTYESLAELYEAAGTSVPYALFVTLWKVADAELQPRVRRKQEMLERLVER
jgi:hypothetical protein